ncbi:hypothetical protein OE810_00050 [Rhodobacteraceae bacterium XHP0102]|nr:hypothetical protein [Rhodobacteraceae bacterium XHP0102]
MKQVNSKAELLLAKHTSETIDELIRRFTDKKLDLADRRTVAINMGKLAASINPKDPLDGAKKITKTAGMFDSHWAKRTRLFRFPEQEAATDLGVDQVYYADPRVFLSLAKASGRLRSGSNDKTLQAQGEKEAIRLMLQGTSFLPSYKPETQAERSLEAIMEQYGLRVSEAIKQRTRIKDLWATLEATPVSLEVSEDPLPPSVYGSSAACPQELLQPAYKDFIKYGQFTPSRTYADMDWAQPTITIGYLLVAYRVHALKIPHDKVDLFPMDWGKFEGCANERNQWLDSIGFDVEGHQFADGEVGRNQAELVPVTVGFIHKVGLGVKKGSDGSAKLQLQIWRASRDRDFQGDTDFLVSCENYQSDFLSVFGNIARDFGKYANETEGLNLPVQVSLGPDFDYDNEDEYAFDAWCQDYAFNCYVAESCVPDGSTPERFLFLKDGFEADNWAEEDDFEEYLQIVRPEGWLESPGSAKLMFGSSNIMFLPVHREAEPKAGAAKEGSIAASLLENALTAAPENRITQKLIEKVSLTAEAGLAFCEALLERSRNALSNI